MTKNIKTILLSFVALVFTILLWWSLKNIFLVFSWLNLTLAILTLIISVSFWVLSIWLGNKWITIIAVFLAQLSLFLFFQLNYLYLIAFVIVLLGFLLAENLITKEEKLRNKIAVDEIIYGGLKAILVTMWILITVMFYYSPYSNITNLPANNFVKDKVLSYYLPGFNSNLTLNEFMLMLMARNTGLKNPTDINNFITQKKQEMSPEEIAKFRKAYLEKVKLNSAQFTGTETIGQTHIIDSIIDQTLNPIIQKIGIIGNIGASVLFYLILSWLVGKIISLLVILLTWICFKIFLKTKFVIIDKKMVESENIKI